MEHTYFTCIGRGHGAPAVPASREDWEQMRREPWLADMCARIEKGDDELKHRLPVWTPSCAEFRDNHRAQADALKPLNRLMLDFDEKGHTDEICEKLKDAASPDIRGMWILMVEESARRGTHVLVELPAGMDATTAQQIMKEVTGFEPDRQVKGVDRCIYMVPEDHTRFVSPKLFELPSTLQAGSNALPSSWETARPEGALATEGTQDRLGVEEKSSSTSINKVGTGFNQTTPNPSLLFKEGSTAATAESLAKFDLCAKEAGLDPNSMDIWGERNWHSNLMAVMSVGVGKLMSREQLFAVVAERLKNYSQTKDCQTLINYFYDNYNADKGFMNAGLREINAKAQSMTSTIEEEEFDQTTPNPSLLFKEGSSGSELSAKRLPQGVKDSVDAVGAALAMPIVTAICPCIGALATGVKLDVHGQMRGLNLISYIAGDFASGKGSIDPVVDAWMSEVKAIDDMYQAQEEEYRRKKNAAKNQKTQPEEPKLPVRYITLNTTVANLAERLGNTEGKHAFSFTPEADTVAQKWRSSMCDFSVMLRQSYDGSRYDREARSAEAVNVHIKQLLWNVTMCGTPDALYRVVTNYTDGFQSRIALAQTPDNTYAPLEDKPYVLTSRQRERIQQIAHLLPLMQGEITLPKLEARGREWLEKIRLEAMKNDDRVKARERFRTCVTTQRMVCCLMLCRVCELLIQKHGFSGAETRLKQSATLWKEMLLKAQTPAMLDNYDIIADALLDNALYFFRERIENAFRSRCYAGGNERRRIGKNDSIYERLDMDFSFDMALQHSVSVNGAGTTRNQVHQMLKNWKNQGLVVQLETGKYRKIMS